MKSEQTFVAAIKHTSGVQEYLLVQGVCPKSAMRNLRSDPQFHQPSAACVVLLNSTGMIVRTEGDAAMGPELAAAAKRSMFSALGIPRFNAGHRFTETKAADPRPYPDGSAVLSKEPAEVWPKHKVIQCIKGDTP